jgi:hypothetical protein
MDVHVPRAITQGLRVTIGQCIGDLEILATAGEPEDFVSRVYYLPLR